MAGEEATTEVLVPTVANISSCSRRLPVIRVDLASQLPIFLRRLAILAAGAVLIPSAWAQAPPGGAAPPAVARQAGRLALHQPVERELGPGQTDVFTVDVAAGLFLHVEAEKKGVDVVLVLADPAGKPLVTADSPNAFGAEPASLIANGGGEYQIRVAKSPRSSETARYRIELTDLHVHQAQDRNRLQAETEFFAAVANDRTQDRETAPGRCWLRTSGWALAFAARRWRGSGLPARNWIHLLQLRGTAEGAGLLQSSADATACGGGRRGRGENAEQHRQCLFDSRGAAEGAGLLQAGATAAACSRESRRRGVYAEQHWHRLFGSWGEAEGARPLQPGVAAMAGGGGPRWGGDDAEQHRQCLLGSWGEAEGAGLLQPGAAAAAGGGGPPGRGGHPGRHRHRVLGPWGEAEGAGLLQSDAAAEAGGGGPRRRGDHAEQHRRGVLGSWAEAEGSGLLRPGAAATACGGGPRGRGGDVEQHGRGVLGSWGKAEGVGLLHSGACPCPSGIRSIQSGKCPRQPDAVLAERAPSGARNLLREA